ncbi:MAG: hypothetical protein P8078_07270, partial [bacterium]
LTKMISPDFRDFIEIFYLKLAEAVQKLGNSTRKIYTGYLGNYVMYIVLFLAVLILIQLKWSVF